MYHLSQQQHAATVAKLHSVLQANVHTLNNVRIATMYTVMLPANVLVFTSSRHVNRVHDLGELVTRGELEKLKSSPSWRLVITS